MSNDFQVEIPEPVSGLGTFATTVQNAGLYTMEVKSTLPWSNQASGAAQEVTNITAVADSSGSLNNTYFTFNGAGDLQRFYVWYNVNSAGVDPAPAGLTGIEVDLATGATASAAASATRIAIAASTSASPYFAISGATTHIIITNKQVGSATNAANAAGGSSPGFTYSVTQAGSYGNASGLNITVNQASTQVGFSGYPSPTQPSLGVNVQIACAASDVISVIFDSDAYIDSLPNAVKSTINFYLKK